MPLAVTPGARRRPRPHRAPGPPRPIVPTDGSHRRYPSTHPLPDPPDARIMGAAPIAHTAPCRTSGPYSNRVMSRNRRPARPPAVRVPCPPRIREAHAPGRRPRRTPHRRRRSDRRGGRHPARTHRGPRPAVPAPCAGGLRQLGRPHDPRRRPRPPRHRAPRFAFGTVDAALFCAGEQVSREWVPVAVAHGALAIDSTAAFRMTPGTPWSSRSSTRPSWAAVRRAG